MKKMKLKKNDESDIDDQTNEVSYVHVVTSLSSAQVPPPFIRLPEVTQFAWLEFRRLVSIKMNRQETTTGYSSNASKVSLKRITIANNLDQQGFVPHSSTTYRQPNISHTSSSREQGFKQVDLRLQRDHDTLTLNNVNQNQPHLLDHCMCITQTEQMIRDTSRGIGKGAWLNANSTYSDQQRIASLANLTSTRVDDLRREKLVTTLMNGSKLVTLQKEVYRNRRLLELDKTITNAIRDIELREHSKYS